MKGTTLTQLKKSYRKQASSLINKTFICMGIDSFDCWVWELSSQERKLQPRGKAFFRMLLIERRAKSEKNKTGGI